jgi:hypothetical protein
LNSDFVEVAPGLFFPKKSEFRVKPTTQEQRTQTITLALESYAVDVEWAPSELRLQFPDGVRVHRNETVASVVKAGFQALFSMPVLVVPILLIVSVAAVYIVIDMKRRRNSTISANKCRATEKD